MTTRFTTGLLVLVALVGCDDPLRDQSSIQPHEQPLRSVPWGVVPREPAEPVWSAAEGADLVNPLGVTRAILSQGALSYDRFCSHCHGSLGVGWTSVGSSFDPAPPDLVEVTADRSDGEVWSIITFGSGRCPALGPSIAVDDRWSIVHHLRQLPQARARRQPGWEL
jgi:mono/diheme cytochrome c family protein